MKKMIVVLMLVACGAFGAEPWDKVQWLGPPVRVGTAFIGLPPVRAGTSFPDYSREIGLRADGVVVWRMLTNTLAYYATSSVTNMVMTDTNAIKKLVKDGEVCKAVGEHKWENTPSINIVCYERHCLICGKVQTRKMEDWK